MKEQLIKYVEEAQYLGDPIYDSHNTPPQTTNYVFLYVRNPVTFLHSLWHHRSKKKKNIYGHKFNWQEDNELEIKCRSNNYYEFLDNVSKNPGVVYKYFEHYFHNYKNLKICKFETLVEDLLLTLNSCGEQFNNEEIIKNANKFIGSNFKNIKPENCAKQEYIQRIKKSEEEFYKKFNYI